MVFDESEERYRYERGDEWEYRKKVPESDIEVSRYADIDIKKHETQHRVLG